MPTKLPVHFTRSPSVKANIEDLADDGAKKIEKGESLDGLRTWIAWRLNAILERSIDPRSDREIITEQVLYTLFAKYGHLIPLNLITSHVSARAEKLIANFCSSRGIETIEGLCACSRSALQSHPYDNEFASVACDQLTNTLALVGMSLQPD